MTPSTIGRRLLGMPLRAFAPGSASPTVDGRAQAPWGRWWDARPRLLHALSLIAIAWTVVYLAWRVGWSWHRASWWLWAMLLIAEGYGLWSLSMLTWLSWRIPPVQRPPATPSRRVDVYVCTYDEPESVLRATLAGCAAMTYPHTTYLLDDGRRPAMAQLARELGARYMTRPDNAHAKAGNINHTLPLTDGELVFVLDADHVPLPDALHAVVGYFDDPALALVQTPHDFYNHDSIQHYEIGRHEQSVFYSVICPGKDRHNAAFWCGSGAVIRRAALLDAGGVATQTIAEDFHTTIKLHRAGWRTRYHDEVLIQGLAPHDLAAYLLQRDRWARGNLAVFTTPESPLRARELTARQRLSYFASLSAYLAGPMRLLMLATLAAVLWTGQLPLTATLLTLGVLWAPATLLSIAAGSALCRGYQRISDTTHFELCTAEIFTRALRCAIRPGRATFRVTPKEGVDLGGLSALRQLPVVVAIAIALGAGLLLRLLGDAGLHLPSVLDLRGLPGIALWVVPLVALFELRRVLRTLLLVARRRQQRVEYRMPLDAPAIVLAGADDPHALPDGAQLQLQTRTRTQPRQPQIGRVRDLSPSGIGLDLPTPIPAGTPLTVTIQLPQLDGDEAPIALYTRSQSCRPAGDRWIVGARIVDCEDSARHRIFEYCYVVHQLQRLRPAPDALPVALPAPVVPALPVAVREPVAVPEMA
ncbi:MAG TPA: glycosyltransferase family 2 protein [Solirubrobacteraceae bacterium]|nr:glycosyltransferase family 2 protein [Solirubrobacteraceae bacterium]